MPMSAGIPIGGEPLALYAHPATLLGPGAAQVYYYHNDHLGTPQFLTNNSGTTAWSADYQPFGTVTLGTQTITNNLRLPGQYNDAESGFYQNGIRNYDPSSGRYTESDPIGLSGGINTYAYAANNPSGFIDPAGMDIVLPTPGGPIVFPIPPISPTKPGPMPPLLPTRSDLCALNPIACTASMTTSAVASVIGSTVKSICKDNYDSCYKRWENEDSRCDAWSGRGPKGDPDEWRRACKVRAADRRTLCYQNGGNPNPLEPPEWSPADLDQ